MPTQKTSPKKKHPPTPHGFRNERQMRLFIFKAIVAGIVGLIVLHSYQVSGAFFIQISGVLLTVFLSIFLGLLCVPFLDSMNRKKIPDWAGMIIIYLVLFVLVGLFALAVYPILSEQFNELTGFITEQFKNLGDSQNPSARKIFSLLPESLREGQTNLWQVFRSNFNTVGESITTYIGEAIDRANGLVLGITNVIIQVILVLTFAFFFVLERHKIYGFFHELLPIATSRYIRKREKDMVDILFAWLRGQAILGISIFLATYAGLWFLTLIGINMEKHFALAFIAGLTEFIPILGPFIALIPALIISFTLGWEAFVAVLILYFIIQRLENNFLVPVVMSKQLNISPFTVLLVMLVGATIFGIVGILLAVPLTSIGSLFVKDWIQKRKRREQATLET